jgi:hypothetical protein
VLAATKRLQLLREIKELDQTVVDVTQAKLGAEATTFLLDEDDGERNYTPNPVNVTDESQLAKLGKKFEAEASAPDMMQEMRDITSEVEAETDATGDAKAVEGE